ncbi:MAG: hypothetical protein HY961_06000 [Ignavibacteriae bacterium]|nr:hypothetical protein [Ignavibacteriota bacterium]
MEAATEARSLLLEKIRDGIRKSDLQSTTLKKKNSRYITVGIIASALSTVIAGVTAAIGPVVAQGPPGWKLTCGLVAVCAGVATVFNGLQQQLSIAEKLAKANSCSGKLHSLEFALAIDNRDPSEVVKEYETLISTYPEIIL